jgi:mannose-6-phosphate isomerase-like protein (cupin superfamily)
MTSVSPDPQGAILVRAADAEQISEPGRRIRLLADSSATGGLLSTQRVTLLNGIDGAHPHHHAKSGELFYVLGGTVQLLVGDQAQRVPGTWRGSWPGGAVLRASLQWR